jgi:hypothetical protein
MREIVSSGEEDVQQQVVVGKYIIRDQNNRNGYEEEI